MNQETLVSELKQRIGEGANISDRTINEFVPTILSQFEDDSQITDDTYKPYVTLLKSIGGQIRHDISEGINNYKNGDELKGLLAKQVADFKAGDEYKTLIDAAIADAKVKWEKDNNPGPKNDPDPNKPDVNKLVSDAVAEALKGLTGEEGAIGKLTKTVTDFTSSYQAQQKQAKESEIKNSLKEYLEGRKADKPAVINLAIERLTLGDTPDLTALKAQVEANYEKFYKEFYGEGSKPFGGSGNGGGNNADADLKARLEQMKKDAMSQANDAETLRKSFV